MYECGGGIDFDDVASRLICFSGTALDETISNFIQMREWTNERMNDNFITIQHVNLQCFQRTAYAVYRRWKTSTEDHPSSSDTLMTETLAYILMLMNLLELSWLRFYYCHTTRDVISGSKTASWIRNIPSHLASPSLRRSVVSPIRRGKPITVTVRRCRKNAGSCFIATGWTTATRYLYGFTDILY